jgi:hypothetical protein
LPTQISNALLGISKASHNIVDEMKSATVAKAHCGSAPQDGSRAAGTILKLAMAGVRSSSCATNSDAIIGAPVIGYGNISDWRIKLHRRHCHRRATTKPTA